MKRRLGLVGTIALGLVLTFAGPAAAAAKTIHVPDDFNPARSDTRATGHYEVQDGALRVWTESNTSTDKVAEYVDTTTPLSEVGEASLELTNNSGTTPPGFQLVVDFDGDGTDDGILVGEPNFYGDNWWLNNGADADVKLGAPHTGGGSGSLWYGTLDEWSAQFPTAVVKAFGFSLGSGVQGDWVIDAINFAGDRYTFVKSVVLTSKDQCKKGGWETSTQPVFSNQGDCVSSFASTK